MIPAALIGFSLGTLIAWWVVLRSLSHGERELDLYLLNPLNPLDPMDEIQTTDPYVYSLMLDCE